FQARAERQATARRISLGLVSLGRYPKRALLAIRDLLGLGLALWLAMSLRLGELYVPPSWGLFLILCTAPLIGLATLIQFGLYRVVTRYMGAGSASGASRSPRGPCSSFTRSSARPSCGERAGRPAGCCRAAASSCRCV